MVAAEHLTLMWTDYLSALLTPVVAIFAVTIAYRQWRTAQNKLKLDLFERRHAIYDGVRVYLTSVMVTGRTTSESELKYLEATRGAKWLLNDDIDSYLHKDLWKKICALGCLQAELKDYAFGQEHTRRIHKQVTTMQWFVDQNRVIDEKFAEFLKLRH